MYVYTENNLEINFKRGEAIKRKQYNIRRALEKGITVRRWGGGGRDEGEEMK